MTKLFCVDGRPGRIPSICEVETANDSKTYYHVGQVLIEKRSMHVPRGCTTAKYFLCMGDAIKQVRKIVEFLMDWQLSEAQRSLNLVMECKALLNQEDDKLVEVVRSAEAS